jgi:hypothetical protein
MRLILDSVLYVLRLGASTLHFPQPGTEHRWFLHLARSSIFGRLAHALVMADRQRVSCEASPTPAPSWMRSPHAPAVLVLPVHRALTLPSAMSAASGMPWSMPTAGS